MFALISHSLGNGERILLQSSHLRLRKAVVSVRNLFCCIRKGVSMSGSTFVEVPVLLAAVSL